MKVRKGRLEDAKNIAVIGQCVWIDTYATGGVRDAISNYVLAEFTCEKVIATLKARDVFVVEDDKQVLGYMVLNVLKQAEIETLYVLPRFQGKGVGAELLNHVIKLRKPIVLSCWDKNDKAIEFYKKYGFQECGEGVFEMEGERHRNLEFKYE